MINLSLSIVVAMTKAGVIGKNGKLPWHIPEELANFKKITHNSIVIMGRRTWDSIPKKFKPLPNRFNVVVTNKLKKYASYSDTNVKFTDSLSDAIAGYRHGAHTRDVNIIGGANVYKQVLPYAHRLKISIVKDEYDGDTFFPEINWTEWQQIEKQEFEKFDFVIYERKIYNN